MFPTLMPPELPLARVASEGSTVIGQATATAEKMTTLSGVWTQYYWVRCGGWNVVMWYYPNWA
jgi:hypothetical protein